MTAVATLEELEALEQLRAYARRWEQICALIHLDPERDPIHTVFEPWKDRREQVALAKRQAHVTSSAEAYSGDEHPYFGQNDAAARHEQHRVEREFDERRVKSLQLELLRLRGQLASHGPLTALAVPRPARQDVIDIEVGVAAPRPGRALPAAEDE